MNLQEQRIDEVVITFPAESKNESFARGVVGIYVSRLDPTMEELADIKTAVSEAVTNCIVHAYPGKTGEVTVRCWLEDSNSVCVEVSDHGVGIPDIETARTPMFTTGGEDRSGMGFTIMEQFMTELKVSSEKDQGTKVTMLRKLSGGGNDR